MKTFITSLAVAMLLAVTANADVIHSTGYETDGAAGTGFGIAPASMGFTDGGGDLQGFTNGDNSGSAFGISNANPNSGSFHYAVDADAFVVPAQGNGWGGSWSGQDTNGGSGGFTSEADALAAGAGCYVDLVGATFTASVMVATDAVDPLTGGATSEIRLEFNGATPDIIPRAVSAPLGAADLSTTYQQLTISHTLTAADVALGIDRVVAVIGTNGHGDNSTAGQIYFDDFLFEVNGANVVLVGDGHTAVVPEPATATLLLGGLLGLCGVRRRKS